MNEFETFLKLKNYKKMVSYNEILTDFRRFCIINHLKVELINLHRSGKFEEYLNKTAKAVQQCCGNKPNYIFNDKNLLNDIIKKAGD